MLNLSRRACALAAATVTAAAAGMLAPAGTATAATGCTVEYAVASQWSGGFVASVGVRNLGDPLNGWRLTWSYGSGQRVTSAWNATVTQQDAQVTAVNAGHNGTLATGASASFGFQGTWTTANPTPTGFALNGATCTGSVGGPSVGVPSSTPTAAPTPSKPPASPGCPAAGHITYTLNRASNPTADQLEAYRLITAAMDQALSVYNCQADITKALRVSYEPGVPTADANINGNIRFGARSTMQQITAMHEISHTLGVGTSSAWAPRLSGGIWTGPIATAELRAQTGDPAAVLHGDKQHFWPYGLNYTSEVTSPNDLVIHCRIVVALRRDMGLS